MSTVYYELLDPWSGIKCNEVQCPLVRAEIGSAFMSHIELFVDGRASGFMVVPTVYEKSVLRQFFHHVPTFVLTAGVGNGPAIRLHRPTRKDHFISEYGEIVRFQDLMDIVKEVTQSEYYKGEPY